MFKVEGGAVRCGLLRCSETSLRTIVDKIYRKRVVIESVDFFDDSTHIIAHRVSRGTPRKSVARRGFLWHAYKDDAYDVMPPLRLISSDDLYTLVVFPAACD